MFMLLVLYTTGSVQCNCTSATGEKHNEERNKDFEQVKQAAWITVVAFIIKILCVETENGFKIHNLVTKYLEYL